MLKPIPRNRFIKKCVGNREEDKLLQELRKKMKMISIETSQGFSHILSKCVKLMLKYGLKGAKYVLEKNCN